MAITTPAAGDLIIPDPIDLLLNRLLFKGAQSSGAVQSLTNSISTAVALDTETIDTYSGHDNTTNNSRYTIPAALNGYRLRISGTVLFAANATGGRVLQLRKSGSVIPPDGQLSVGNASASFGTIAQAQYDEVVATGDYWELVAIQNSGGALSTTTGSTMRVEFMGLS